MKKECLWGLHISCLTIDWWKSHDMQVWIKWSGPNNNTDRLPHLMNPASPETRSIMQAESCTWLWRGCCPHMTIKMVPSIYITLYHIYWSESFNLNMNMNDFFVRAYLQPLLLCLSFQIKEFMQKSFSSPKY